MNINAKKEFSCVMTCIVIIFLCLASPFQFAYGNNALPTAEFQDLRAVGSARIQTIINPLTLQGDDGTLYRLSGVEYPDYNFTDAPGELSLTAHDILKDLLIDQEVLLYQTKTRDSGRVNRMGHMLVHMARKDDGAWVQGTLISLGLARVYTTKSNAEMAAAMYALENTARAEDLGLWAVPAYSVQGAQGSIFENLHRFQVVEGTVQSVAMVKNKTYVNFGDDWRNDFTVIIDSDARRLFRKAQIDPQQFNGVHLRVRGWVSDYNGPYIDVSHPAQIEILSTEEKSIKSDLPGAAQAPKVGIIE